MSGNGTFFVEWKEQFVSQERGNRVVHYFLKDSAGESILAVVGTERSVRHMFYVVAEEFVRVHGAETSIHAGFKWRSRREVVDWLTSMLSKKNLQRDRSKSPEQGPIPAFGPECPTNGGRLSRHFNGRISDIVWSGVPWTCGKHLKHFPAFCRNGTTIAIQSFVFVMGKGEHHYLAYLEDMYEDKRGQKKVKVRWFHHNQEVKGVVPLKNPHPKEVFMTPYAQVISAECVDGPAAVLTREHYEKCLAAFPNGLLARVHMCFRQFKSNRVKPFDLSKLHGYFDQPILSCLDSDSFQKTDPGEDENLSWGETIKLGTKRTRDGGWCQKFQTIQSGLGVSGRGSHMMTIEAPYHNLKYGLSGRRLLPAKQVEYQHWCTPPYSVDERIELLCQDSGIRGCWFRCTVLQVSRKQMKVRYDDVQDEDGCGNLEEWIPTFKQALPDKLGMRCSGRPIVRPAPHPKDKRDVAFEVGVAVDAWWSDGWWEGVVTRIDDCGDDNLQVYFPGENLFMNMHNKDLRISRDWVGNHWIDIEARPDILSAISVAISPETKISVSSTIIKEVKSDDLPISHNDVLMSSNLDDVKKETSNSAALASSDNIPVDMNLVSNKEPPTLKQEAAEDRCESMDACADEVNDPKVCDKEDGCHDNENNSGKVDVEIFDDSRRSCNRVELMEIDPGTCLT